MTCSNIKLKQFMLLLSICALKITQCNSNYMLYSNLKKIMNNLTKNENLKESEPI